MTSVVEQGNLFLLQVFFVVENSNNYFIVSCLISLSFRHAAILYDFVSCTGIEILEGLYSLSLDALASYNTKGKSKLDRDRDTCEHFQIPLKPSFTPSLTLPTILPPQIVSFFWATF